MTRGKSGRHSSVGGDVVDWSQTLSDQSADMMELLRELVECESPSTDKNAVDKLGVRLAAAAETFGGAVQLLPQDDFGNHLKVTFDGEGPKSLLLVGHMDTVWEMGTLSRSPFHVDSDGRAFGPGVFDMKAGIVQMLFAIRMLGANLPCRIVALLTSDEEVGSPSSRQHVEREAAAAAACLVLEPSLPPDGRIKTERKGVGVFQLTVKGRAAHAGLEPEKGISAIEELSHQIQALHALNDPARGISVNVGKVRGGSRGNVIAAEAVAEVDVRMKRVQDAIWIESQLKRLEPVLEGAELVWSGQINRPPLEKTEASDELFRIARRVADKLGFELGEGAAGGGSDGNFTAALGVPTLDGLGVTGDGAHAKHEHIVVADLPRRTALLAGLIAEIAGRAS